MIDLAEWPPAGVEPVAMQGFYDLLAESGLDYGPAFQGLRAVWRRGDEVFAEVALPEHIAAEAGRFGLHPALLDAALHAIGVGVSIEDSGDARLPYSWSGLSLHAAGAAALRVRMSPDGAGRRGTGGGRRHRSAGRVRRPAGDAAGVGAAVGQRAGRASGFVVRGGLGRGDGGRRSALAAAGAAAALPVQCGRFHGGRGVRSARVRVSRKAQFRTL